MQQRSMGERQPKKDSCHGCAVAGDLELMASLGLASTSLSRAFHSLTSVSLMGPELGWPGWVVAGADIVGGGSGKVSRCRGLDAKVKNDGIVTMRATGRRQPYTSGWVRRGRRAASAANRSDTLFISTAIPASHSHRNLLISHKANRTASLQRPCIAIGATLRHVASNLCQGAAAEDRAVASKLNPDDFTVSGTSEMAWHSWRRRALVRLQATLTGWREGWNF